MSFLKLNIHFHPVCIDQSAFKKSHLQFFLHIAQINTKFSKSTKNYMFRFKDEINAEENNQSHI